MELLAESADPALRDRVPLVGAGKHPPDRPVCSRHLQMALNRVGS
jgi:hypothetical protein